MFVASTTGDKWLVVCVLAARASSDETTFAHVVTRVGPDGEPVVSQHCFFDGFERFWPIKDAPRNSGDYFQIIPCSLPGTFCRFDR